MSFSHSNNDQNNKMKVLLSFMLATSSIAFNSPMLGNVHVNVNTNTPKRLSTISATPPIPSALFQVNPKSSSSLEMAFLDNIPNPFADDNSAVQPAPPNVPPPASNEPEALFSRAKAIVASDLGLRDPTILADDFTWVGPNVITTGPLNRDEYLAAGQFFDLRKAFPDLDYRAHDFRLDSLDPQTVRLTARTVGTMRGELRLRAETLMPNGVRMICPPEAISMTFDPKSGKLSKLCSGFCMDRLVGNTGGLCGVMAAATVAGSPPSEWELYPPSVVVSRFFRRSVQQLKEPDQFFLAPFPESVMIQLAKGVLAADTGNKDPDLLADDFTFCGPFVGPLNKGEYLAENSESEIRKAFPDLNENYSNFRVDPYDPYRVWYDVKASGTMTGNLNGRAPDGSKYVGPPEAASMTFDDDGFSSRITGGAVMDPTDCNTGGLGGVFGILYAAGAAPSPIASRPLPQILSRIQKGLLSPLTGEDVDNFSMVDAKEERAPLPPTPPPEPIIEERDVSNSFTPAPPVEPRAPIAPPKVEAPKINPPNGNFFGGLTAPEKQRSSVDNKKKEAEEKRRQTLAAAEAKRQQAEEKKAQAMKAASKKKQLADEKKEQLLKAKAEEILKKADKKPWSTISLGFFGFGQKEEDKPKKSQPAKKAPEKKKPVAASSKPKPAATEKKNIFAASPKPKPAATEKKNIFAASPKPKSSAETSKPKPPAKISRPKAPPVPTIKNWRQNSNGSITGFIFGSPGFGAGESITTSPIRGMAEENAEVTTRSGSKYILGKASIVGRKRSLFSSNQMDDMISQTSKRKDGIRAASNVKVAAKRNAELESANRARAEATSQRRAQLEAVNRTKVEAAAQKRAQLEAANRAKVEAATQRRAQLEALNRAKVEAAATRKAQLETAKQEKIAAAARRKEEQMAAQRAKFEAIAKRKEEQMNAQRAKIEAIAKMKEEQIAAQRAKVEAATKMKQGQIDAAKKARLEAASRNQASLNNVTAKGKGRAPPGVPSIIKWKREPNGSITGLIYDSPSFRNGSKITTSKLAAGQTPAPGELVVTGSGSKYFLK